MLIFSVLVLALEIVQISSKSPILVCHAPLEIKIFDSPFHATSANLKPCNEIILSSVYPFFLYSDAKLSSAALSEKRNMELLRQQTPEAQFGFSLRFSNASTGSLKNLKTIFEGNKSIVLLTEFLRNHRMKTFDVTWNLIESASDFVILQSLKRELTKEGFNLTTTVCGETTNVTHIANIASNVDRISLTPASNRHYGRTEKELTSREPDRAFDSLELNEGKFLSLYLSLNMSREKVVVGLSLQSIIWKTNSTSPSPSSSTNSSKIVLPELKPYSESCKTFNSSWKLLPDQPSPFYFLAEAPSKDQWMVHVNRNSLGRRVELLRQHGFGGVALYDYYQDDYTGSCNNTGSSAASLYPLIQQAGRSLRDTTTAQSYPEIDLAKRVCIPFLGLTFDCQGAFNYGTQKPKTTAIALLNSTSTLTLTSSLSTAAATISSITTAIPFNQPRIGDNALKNASKAQDSNSKQQNITSSESSITASQTTAHETAATTFISSAAHVTATVTVAEDVKMMPPTSSSIAAINELSNNYIVTETSTLSQPGSTPPADDNKSSPGFSSEIFGSFANITANTLLKLEALISDAKVETLIETSLEGRELYDKIHTVLTQMNVDAHSDSTTTTVTSSHHHPVFSTVPVSHLSNQDSQLVSEQPEVLITSSSQKVSPLPVTQQTPVDSAPHHPSSSIDMTTNSVIDDGHALVTSETTLFPINQVSPETRNVVPLTYVNLGSTESEVPLEFTTSSSPFKNILEDSQNRLLDPASAKSDSSLALQSTAPAIPLDSTPSSFDIRFSVNFNPTELSSLPSRSSLNFSDKIEVTEDSLGFSKTVNPIHDSSSTFQSAASSSAFSTSTSATSVQQTEDIIPDLPTKELLSSTSFPRNNEDEIGELSTADLSSISSYPQTSSGLVSSQSSALSSTETASISTLTAQQIGDATDIDWTSELPTEIFSSTATSSAVDSYAHQSDKTDILGATTEFSRNGFSSSTVKIDLAEASTDTSNTETEDSSAFVSVTSYRYSEAGSEREATRQTTNYAYLFTSELPIVEFAVSNNKAQTQTEDVTEKSSSSEFSTTADATDVILSSFNPQTVKDDFLFTEKNPSSAYYQEAENSTTRFVLSSEFPSVEEFHSYSPQQTTEKAEMLLLTSEPTSANQNLDSVNDEILIYSSDSPSLDTLNYNRPTTTISKDSYESASRSESTEKPLSSTHPQQSEHSTEGFVSSSFSADEFLSFSKQPDEEITDSHSTVSSALSTSQQLEVINATSILPGDEEENVPTSESSLVDKSSAITDSHSTSTSPSSFAPFSDLFSQSTANFIERESTSDFPFEDSSSSTERDLDSLKEEHSDDITSEWPVFNQLSTHEPEYTTRPASTPDNGRDHNEIKDSYCGPNSVNCSAATEHVQQPVTVSLSTSNETSNYFVSNLNVTYLNQSNVSEFLYVKNWIANLCQSIKVSSDSNRTKEELSPPDFPSQKLCQEAGNSPLLQLVFCQQTSSHPNLIKHVIQLLPSLVANVSKTMEIEDYQAAILNLTEPLSRLNDSIAAIGSSITDQTSSESNKNDPIIDLFSPQNISSEDSSIIPTVESMSYNQQTTEQGSAPTDNDSTGNIESKRLNLTTFLKGVKTSLSLAIKEYLNKVVFEDTATRDKLLANSKNELESLASNNQDDMSGESSKEYPPCDSTTLKNADSTEVSLRESLRDLNRHSGINVNVPAFNRQRLWRTVSPNPLLFRSAKVPPALPVKKFKPINF